MKGFVICCLGRLEGVKTSRFFLNYFILGWMTNLGLMIPNPNLINFYVMYVTSTKLISWGDDILFLILHVYWLFEGVMMINYHITCISISWCFSSLFSEIVKDISVLIKKEMGWFVICCFDRSEGTKTFHFFFILFALDGC